MTHDPMTHEAITTIREPTTTIQINIEDEAFGIATGTNCHWGSEQWVAPLSVDKGAHAYESGHSLTLNEAIALALEEQSTPADSPV